MIATIPPPDETGADGAPDADHGPYRILLVEDDRGDALLVEVALEEALPDAEVSWHTSLPDSHDVAEVRPDCVLVDLGLPGLVGLEALDALISLDLDAPVIVLTGLHDRPTGLSALAHGAADFLVKGEHDAAALARAIRYAVERHRAAVSRALWRESELLRAANLRLERGLLARPLVTDPSVVWAARYRPGAGASVLGGDFFDTVELPDGSLRMVMGDVCGHGPDEAALGVCLRVAWRTLVLAGGPDEDVLPGLDAVLRVERQSNQFCTVCDVTISPDRRRMSTRLAGHPPPVILGDEPCLADGSHRGAPLGIATRWSTAEVEMKPVWGLLVYTDGLFEPAAASGGRMGLEGLLSLVSQGPPPRGRGDLEALLDRLEEPHVTARHDDDLAVVGLLVGQ